MPSRTYRTCERIMEAVVKAGYLQKISWQTLRKFIKKIAGGDKRTVDAYREHLVDFEFMKPFPPSTNPGKARLYTIDLMKLPYAQTRLDEIMNAEKVIVERK